MKRRRLLAGLVATALALRAEAQERARTVGYLLEGDGHPRRLSARLAELGYVEGKNLRFELRQVPTTPTVAQLDQAARELAGSGAEVLVSSGALKVTALHRATSKIPIVSGGVSNPVSLGLARSLRAPGMNVTGLSFGLEEAAVLQFGTLKALRPTLRRVVFLLPDNDPDMKVTPEHAAAATNAGMVTDAVRIKDVEAVERVLAGLRSSTDAAWIAQQHVGLGIKHIAAVAIRYRIATHGLSPDAVRDGLLFCHWLEQTDPAGRMASIVDKILRGTDPATIPFELPDKTVLVINRATAAAIGVTISDDFRLRATQIVG